MDRDRIDIVRKALVEAFMAADDDSFALAVAELERLIGVEPGRMCFGEMQSGGATKSARFYLKKRKRRKFQFKNVEAELEDGILTYSIKHE